MGRRVSVPIAVMKHRLNLTQKLASTAHESPGSAVPPENPNFRSSIGAKAIHLFLELRSGEPQTPNAIADADAWDTWLCGDAA